MSDNPSYAAAVIGVGQMGRNHARIYANLDFPECFRLVAVCDVVGAQAREVSRKHGGKPYSSAEEMLERERPDLVSVAVPTVFHRQVAELALAAGAHVVVEKPLASTREDAIAVCDAARKAGRRVFVGHVERFNPAVRTLKRLLDREELGTLYRLDLQRLGPSPERIRDVGVTLDLATHDLDLMLYLSGDEPRAISASLQHVLHDELDDGVAGWVLMCDGLLCTFQADWLTAAKVRKVTATCKRGVIRADLIRRTVNVIEGGKTEPYQAKTAASTEPLYEELDAAAGVCIYGEEGNLELATCEDGFAALTLALDVLRSGTEKKTVTY